MFIFLQKHRKPILRNHFATSLQNECIYSEVSYGILNPLNFLRKSYKPNEKMVETMRRIN